MRRLHAVLAALTVLAGPLLLAAPAESATSPWRGVLTFDKNGGNQYDSRLTWQLFHRESGSWKVVESRSWRAGSGLPGGGGKDSCATSRGWLPTGTDRRGDQACRWEWPRINDYKSLGCIKMSPGDLAQLTAMFHRHFAAGVRYPADRVALRVVS